jgi:mRNA interferase RelE/StbE
MEMKRLSFAPSALNALKRYSNEAGRIRAKIDDYKNGKSMPGSLKMLTTGQMRLRIGDFRVIFIETPEVIIIQDIAPRGNIYKD